MRSLASPLPDVDSYYPNQPIICRAKETVCAQALTVYVSDSVEVEPSEPENVGFIFQVDFWIRLRCISCSLRPVSINFSIMYHELQDHFGNQMGSLEP
jgi:hypothetical protein